MNCNVHKLNLCFLKQETPNNPKFKFDTDISKPLLTFKLTASVHKKDAGQNYTLWYNDDTPQKKLFCEYWLSFLKYRGRAFCGHRTLQKDSGCCTLQKDMFIKRPRFF